MPPQLDRRGFLGGLAAAVAAGPQLLGQDRYPVAPPPRLTHADPFDPDTLFLTWQRDPTTTMTVQWIGSAATPSEDTAVRFSLRGTAQWAAGPATSRRPFPVVNNLFGLPTGPTDLAVFRAELTGLTPGTEYDFRLGTRSPVYRFRTMPAKATNSFTFVSGGDCGTGPAAVANNRMAARQDPMFALVGGDLGYDNGTSGSTALRFIRNYSRTMTDGQGRLIPLLACIGNHEVNGGYNKSLKQAPFFDVLFDGLYSETSYARLDFGDYLSLVLLDSGHAAKIGGEQAAWLDRALADRAGVANLIAVNHVPAYPSFRLAETADMKGGTGQEQRKFWVPLFEKHQVDVVLEHHDHTFKRTHPLRGGVVDERTGIVYLGDGSWGQLRAVKNPEERPYLAEASTAYHVTLHRLEGENRFHLAMDETGKVLDVTRTAKKPRHHTPRG